MSVEDLKIKCEIRNILVQFWIDTTKINVSSHRGVVYFRGKLERVKKQHSLVSKDIHEERDILSTIVNIEERLRRIRNVKRVVFDIENLTKVGNTWRKK